eukprot:jgi/Ulvmu1/2087/UM124_0001.1
MDMLSPTAPSRNSSDARAATGATQGIVTEGAELEFGTVITARSMVPEAEGAGGAGPEGGLVAQQEMAVGGSCNDTPVDVTIYDHLVEGYSDILSQAISGACSATWRGNGMELAALFSSWSFTWAQVTGAEIAKVPCAATLAPPGSSAAGCEWSEGSAYAAADAIADAHATAAAAAFNQNCNTRCAAAEGGGAGWEFASPEATLLITSAAYAAASEAACRAGQQSSSAAEWSFCYGRILEEEIVTALLRSLVQLQCFTGPLLTTVEIAVEDLQAVKGLCFPAAL